MNRRQTILIVDDESKIRRLISLFLEKKGFDVCTADNGFDALEVVHSLSEKPDLIVLDYMMPEMDGFSFLDILRKTENIPVLFLSARGELSCKTTAFEKGADDYLVKPFAMEELMARIQAILRRAAGIRHQISSVVIENGSLKLYPQKRICRYKNTEIKLADTEFRLLTVLTKHPGHVFTHEQLLGKVWGPEYIGELNYLRVAFTRIRKKLSEAGLDGAVISSYSGIGYRIAELKE